MKFLRIIGALLVLTSAVYAADENRWQRVIPVDPTGNYVPPASPGTANPNPGSDYATSARQDTNNASVQAVKAALGSPFQVGGNIGNTAFGITGPLPGFATPPTVNVGTTGGIALDTSLQAVKTALGSPFQVGGVIGNTAFGITGPLPGFATPPTVNAVQPDVRSSGTLDMTSTANVLTIPVPQGTSTMSLNFVGVTGSGAQLAINGTSNGTNYGVLGIYTRTGAGAPTSVINDQTGLIVSVAGLQSVQVVVNTAGTGSVTISYTISSAPYTPNVMNISASRGGLTNAWRINVSGATTQATSMKTTPGRVYKITGYNTTNSLRWLHFYNSTTTPVPGTTPVFFALALPPGPYSYDAMDIGYYFSGGIGYSITTGAADSDATAGAAGDIVNQNIWYQ